MTRIVFLQGLKGEDIHLFARIVAIADFFDALSNFDPKLTGIFLNNIEEFLKIQKKYID